MLRNFKASFTTYLPVKPEAPKIIMSYRREGFWSCDVCMVFGFFFLVLLENESGRRKERFSFLSFKLATEVNGLGDLATVSGRFRRI